MQPKGLSRILNKWNIYDMRNGLCVYYISVKISLREEKGGRGREVRDERGAKEYRLGNDTMKGTADSAGPRKGH